MAKAAKKINEKERISHERKVLVVTAAISASMILGGISLGDPSILGNLIILSIFVTAVPYFFFKYAKYMWLRTLELEFPNFVRDLADSLRSMPLPEALAVVSKANYGNLSPEIKSMYNRMTWGIPFLDALSIFEKRVKGSKTISESMLIIRQSYESGGHMVFTLESITRDLLMLREVDQERQSLLREHIMVMYAIFAMFLGISLMIIFVMVPMFESQGSMPSGSGFQQGLTFSNPCAVQNAGLFPCGIYIGVATTLGISPETIGAYYIALFFSSLIVQGIFVGLITGQLGENSVVAGIKHSIIMTFLTIAVFLFFTRMGAIA
jgi:flagellar protein FlaJ